jgi:transcriptional regulator with XRE-family HTH domain
MPESMNILEAIRKVIEMSRKTRYRIAKDTGMDESHLGKFLKGQAGLSVERLTRLTDYLGLELIVRPKKGKGTRGKHRE